MAKTKKNISDKIKFLYMSNIGRLLSSFILAILFLTIHKLLYNFSEGYNDWALYVAIIPTLYIVGFSFIMIIYGLIINPIRDYKSKKKK
jgi:hypothetical protein